MVKQDGTMLAFRGVVDARSCMREIKAIQRLHGISCVIRITKTSACSVDVQFSKGSENYIWTHGTNNNKNIEIKVNTKFTNIVFCMFKFFIFHFVCLARQLPGERKDYEDLEVKIPRQVFYNLNYKKHTNMKQYLRTRFYISIQHFQKC